MAPTKETSTAPEPAATAGAQKWVHLFSEGSKDMRDLLGGKGAGVAEMTRAGMPVPPGFTITTEACREYYRLGKRFPDGLWEQAEAALREVEGQTGKGFGDARNPLLVSVRSGAKFSMPGMMDTVLNLGLNQQTLQGLQELTGNERFALDAYRRFIQMFGKIVKGIEGDLFEEALTAAKQKAGVEGVSLEDCERVSDVAGPLLDQADLIPGPYNLEVSSPGAERPLRNRAEYERFLGRKVNVRHQAGPAEAVIEGHLMAVDVAGIAVRGKAGQVVHLSWPDVIAARLAVEI
jgi:ribosome maturation factor RimP